MTDKLLVLTTTGSEAEASKIAEMLVGRRLAACVNIIPRIQSVYPWQGRVESAEEFLLIAKTSQGKEQEVHAAIREMHSYQPGVHFDSDPGRQCCISGSASLSPT
jgi:periplasmic divalent cation tolerance protein